MNKPWLVALLCLLCIAPSIGACSRPPETEPAATQDSDGRAELGNSPPASFEESVPAGWTIEHSVTGDLNADGRPDAALSLLQRPTPEEAEGTVERPRALLLLFADPSGGYRRQALAKRLLPCTTCLGMLGAYTEAASPVDMSIAGGRLRVSWLKGAREAVEVSLEFGYEPALGGFRLLRDDVYRVDRVLGRETRTVRDLVRGEVIVDGKIHTVEPSVIPLGDVDFSTY